MPSKTLSVIISEETQKRLEQFAKSRLWSVSQTARVLIEQGLEREGIEPDSTNGGKPTQTQPSNLKELIRQRYFDLMNSGKLGHARLKELSFGQKPSAKEKQLIAEVLGLDELPEE